MISLPTHMLQVVKDMYVHVRCHVLPALAVALLTTKTGKDFHCNNN